VTDIQANINSGRRTTISGCVVALAGMIVPLIMLLFAGPESALMWQAYILLFTITPVMVIVGIAVSTAGLRKMLKAGRELGPDSDAGDELGPPSDR
jgi:heme/copper-type cytochrome/quinol oxidase subunit 4